MNTVFVLESSCRFQLFFRVINPCDSGTSPRKPRRNISRSTSKLDYIEPCDVRQDPSVRLWNAPNSPARLILFPCSASGFRIIFCESVPCFAISQYVIRKNFWAQRNIPKIFLACRACDFTEVVSDLAKMLLGSIFFHETFPSFNF